jgi:antitoxin ParD1/3/4
LPDAGQGVAEVEFSNAAEADLVDIDEFSEARFGDEVAEIYMHGFDSTLPRPSRLTHRKAYNPPMTAMTVNFAPDVEKRIAARIAEAGYADAQDYLSELVRLDGEGAANDPPESPEYVAWVREKIAEAEASPLIDRDPREIIAEIIAERHAKGG